MSLRLASPPLMARFATSMARARSCPDAPWTSSDGWGGLGGASIVREGPIEPRRPIPAPVPRATQPLRLSERAREAMRLRHFSPRTEQAYLDWARRYCEFHGGRDPALLGAQQVTAFLNALATRGHIAASTQNQALAALFL